LTCFLVVFFFVACPAHLNSSKIEGQFENLT
jgi:hypothetical protein